MKTRQTHKTANKIRQCGIGLLELMLSLTIIAILLIAATRYYQSAQASRQIKVAVESIQVVYAATQQYYNDNGKIPDSLDTLVANSMLPSQFKSFASPWGGTVTGTKGTGKFTLTFPTNVPNNICTNISNKIKANYGTDTETDIKVICPGIPGEDKIGNMSIDYTFS